jgi:hypothetical protein
VQFTPIILYLVIYQATQQLNKKKKDYFREKKKKLTILESSLAFSLSNPNATTTL